MTDQEAAFVAGYLYGSEAQVRAHDGLIRLAAIAVEFTPYANDAQVEAAMRHVRRTRWGAEAAWQAYRLEQAAR